MTAEQKSYGIGKDIINIFGYQCYEWNPYDLILEIGSLFVYLIMCKEDISFGALFDDEFVHYKWMQSGILQCDNYTLI